MVNSINDIQDVMVRVTGMWEAESEASVGQFQSRGTWTLALDWSLCLHISYHIFTLILYKILLNNGFLVCF